MARRTTPPHPTYRRLREAAERFRGWHDRTQILAGLLHAFADRRLPNGRPLGMSPQVLTNWQDRGIPQDKLLPVAQAIGCDPAWLQSGIGDPRAPDYSATHAAPPPAPPGVAESPADPYDLPEEVRLLLLFKRLSPRDRAVFLAQLDAAVRLFGTEIKKNAAP